MFGSVTCLPGWYVPYSSQVFTFQTLTALSHSPSFSMYRIRTLEHKPVIISDAVLAEYGENKVETLHVKNLLSLGEDRYLTTVILKVSRSLFSSHSCTS